MTLRKIPLRAPGLQTSASPKLVASPYNKGGTGHFAIKRDLVKSLFAWMTSVFKPETMYGEFELARAMGVHRIIADEWLCALCELGYVQSYSHGNDILQLHCLVFRITGKLHREYKPLNKGMDFSDLQDYDPWQHRDYDGVLSEALYPDRYCDKFYVVAQHEYFLVHRKQRVRTNSRMFVPISDYPIMLASYEKRRTDPPPITLRDELDARMSGERTRMRAS